LVFDVFTFQAFAQKEEEQSPSSQAKKKAAEQSAEPEIISEHIVASKADMDKVFRKKGISEFLTTLTPGAQNAIYAASAAWGYENAAKYVKNSMKLEEVKNSIDSTERSKSVLESVTSQAQAEHSETSQETSKFVWGFYNEDMKETQAQAGKSEHITERQKAARQELVLPASAHSAVMSSIAENTNNPALLYCTSAQQVAEDQRAAQLEAQKKEELARLVLLPGVKAASPPTHKVEAEPSSLVLSRREEVLAEYEKTEKQLETAIKVLDQLETENREDMEKAASMLPKELSKLVMRKKSLLSSRKALRLQLVKWVTFCTDSRQAIKDMPGSRLLKLASLSTLLKIGK